MRETLTCEECGCTFDHSPYQIPDGGALDYEQPRELNVCESCYWEARAAHLRMIAERSTKSCCVCRFCMDHADRGGK